MSFDGIEKGFFGVPVLKRVRFSARAGRITGLVGENGAGKSTLMRLALDMLRPVSGSVEALGELGVYAEIVPCHRATERLAALGKSVRGIVLSGGPSSIYDDGALTMPAGVILRMTAFTVSAKYSVPSGANTMRPAGSAGRRQCGSRRRAPTLSPWTSVVPSTPW